MIDIIQAASAEQLDHVRGLVRAFVEWYRQRHLADIALIDRYFDPAELERELATLLGK